MAVGCAAAVDTFARRALALGGIQITPATALMGGAVRIAFELTNTQAQAQAQNLLVDLAVHDVKASGQPRVKASRMDG